MKGALVTGSARGIGRELALTLAGLGYAVAIHYRRSRTDAEDVAAEIEAAGGRALTLRADVTEEAEASELVDRAREAFGRLDVLVNNVGNYHHAPLEALGGAAWREMFDSNLHATFYTCQRAAPHLREVGGGRIVNLGYAGAESLTAKPGVIAYQVAKAGVALYSRALAKREAPYGTTVNVIAPGVIENSVTMPLREIPMGRTGTLAEVAGALRYLVSDDARYVTGTSIRVGGGWNL